MNKYTLFVHIYNLRQLCNLLFTIIGIGFK